MGNETSVMEKNTSYPLWLDSVSATLSRYSRRKQEGEEKVKCQVDRPNRKSRTLGSESDNDYCRSPDRRFEVDERPKTTPEYSLNLKKFSTPKHKKSVRLHKSKSFPLKTIVVKTKTLGNKNYWGKTQEGAPVVAVKVQDVLRLEHDYSNNWNIDNTQNSSSGDRLSLNNSASSEASLKGLIQQRKGSKEDHKEPITVLLRTTLPAITNSETVDAVDVLEECKLNGQEEFWSTEEKYMGVEDYFMSKDGKSDPANLFVCGNLTDGSLLFRMDKIRGSENLYEPLELLTVAAQVIQELY